MMSGFEWKDVRVVVTGGAGFLGRHVCRELEWRGARAVEAPRSSRYDLTRREAVVAMYRDLRPDIVIHLAAEVGGIGANRANPGRYFYANMAMALNTIEVGREFGLQKFVQAGTICAYPKHTPVPFREESLWNGFPEETNAPYGIAKKAALTMLQSYREQYDFPGIYLLPVNLYGPHDNFDLQTSHVIPAMIRKFAAARENRLPRVTLWGSGTVSREFLYVEDAAEGIVAATELYDGADPVNLGSGHEIRIDELAELIAGIVGFEGDIRWDRAMPEGQPRRCLDTSRARERFGFQAKTSLELGLARTVTWWNEINREIPCRFEESVL